jgi:CheY-like chemotaxis protein
MAGFHRGATMRDLPQILLVDDSRQDLELVQEACADSGLTAIFHISRDGAEAVQALTRLSLQGVDLDLIVLDLFMPQKDGFRVLQHLQSQERLESVPVIVLTASADMGHVERCFRLGADFFLWKPAVYEDYHVIAQRILELLEAPPRPRNPAPTLVEREELMWGLHSPGKWAGLGG